MQIMQIAVPMSAPSRPEDSTGPVSARVTRGSSRPTSVTASVAAAKMTKSLIETQRFI